MNYLNLNNQQIYSIGAIRDRHPNVSIPNGARLDDLGYAMIAEMAQPIVEPGYQVIAGEPEEYEPGKWRETWLVQSIPRYIPSVVSRFQAKAALAQAGLLASVETLMNDPNTDILAKLAWSDAQEFQRTSPTIAAMASVLGLTDVQLDDLFVAASGITA